MSAIQETLLILGIRRGYLERDVPEVHFFNNNFNMVFASLAVLERDGEPGREKRDYMWGSSGVVYLENLGETWTRFRNDNDDLFQEIFPLVLEEYDLAKRLAHARTQLGEATLFQRRKLLREEKALGNRVRELMIQINPHLEEMAKRMLAIGIPEAEILKLGHNYGRLMFSEQT